MSLHTASGAEIKAGLKDAIDAVRFAALCNNLAGVKPVVMLFSSDGPEARTAVGIDRGLTLRNLDCMIASLVGYRDEAAKRGEL